MLGFPFRSQLSSLRTSLIVEVEKVGTTSIFRGFRVCACHTLLPLTQKSKTKTIPPKQKSVANLRFLFPYLATTPLISWVFAKVEHMRLDFEYRRPSPNLRTRRGSPNHVFISIRMADASLLRSLLALRSAMETNH